MSDAFTAPTHPATSRRGFLRTAGLAGGALLAPTALSACATGAVRKTAESTGPTGPMDPENPFGASKALESVVFDGGNGVEYLDLTKKIYLDAHPDIDVTITKTQDLSTLQSQFVNQTPPDLWQNSGAKALDVTSLTLNEQLAELEDLMAAPSWDDPDVTVEESLNGGVRDDGTVNGKLVGLNFVQYAWGIWHDAALFEEKGWEMPGSWEDLMSLCGRIKADGIAPWAFTGVHPSYFQSGVLFPLVVKFGDQEVWKRVDNLEPDAWRQQPIRDALEALLQLRTDDFILRGVAQMTHIQSQTAWLQHKAAFIPVGAWLENEMKSTIPDGFELTATSLPGPDGKLTDLVPNNAGAGWYIPAQAKNPGSAKEFLRALLSRESARNYAELTRNITVVTDAHEGQELGAAFNSIASMIAKSNRTEPWINVKYPSWYKSLSSESEAALMALLLGDATVDDYVNRCQRKADEVKNDPKTKKITR